MNRFITHECIAHGVFGRSYNSGTGQLSAWEKHLQNTPELEVLLVKRLCADYLGMSLKMRRPWGLKDVDARLR